MFGGAIKALTGGEDGMLGGLLNNPFTQMALDGVATSFLGPIAGSMAVDMATSLVNGDNIQTAIKNAANQAVTAGVIPGGASIPGINGGELDVLAFAQGGDTQANILNLALGVASDHAPEEITNLLGGLSSQKLADLAKAGVSLDNPVIQEILFEKALANAS